MDIAEQIVTPALVAYYQDVKKIFAVIYSYLFGVYANLTLHILKFSHIVGLCIVYLLFFPQTYFV